MKLKMGQKSNSKGKKKPINLLEASNSNSDEKRFNPGINELKENYYKLEDEYFQAVRQSKQCVIEQIRIDKDDSLRALILEKLFYDIKKRFLEFWQDTQDENQILHNSNLDQQQKLLLKKKHKSFHEKLKRIYGPKSYELFCQLMRIIV